MLVPTPIKAGHRQTEREYIPFVCATHNDLSNRTVAMTTNHAITVFKLCQVVEESESNGR